MQLFVYEFVSGGGWYCMDGDQPPPHGLLAEGRAMRDALLADLAAVPGITVETLSDVRISAPAPPGCNQIAVASAAAERAAFWAAAARADWTLVVAPEFDGHLLERNRWVIEAGGRLLGHPRQLVELCSDKHRTAELLRSRGIPAPAGWLLEAQAALPPTVPLPAVLKPLDGAGSLDVRLLRAPADFPGPADARRRLERYCPGLPASISCLCGPRENRILPAGEQLLSRDDRFRYRGGRLPLPESLNRRARRLAAGVLEQLPGALGFLGIDLVLGPDPAGSQDVVIEINPRLTTSYVGLRQLAAGNLGAAMLAIATGRPAALSFGRQGVQFAPKGPQNERVAPAS